MNAKLRPSQVKLLQALLAGKRGADIARERNQPRQTVNANIRYLCRRVGVRTPLQLGAWAERHGIREAGSN